MSAQHTPGPWSASARGDGWHICAHTPIKGGRTIYSRIATAHGMQGADAKLIAAAPDLLAALQELILTKMLHDHLQTLRPPDPESEEGYRKRRAAAWAAAREAIIRATQP